MADNATPRDLERGTQAADKGAQATGYRNIFTDAGEQDCFQGFGTDSEAKHRNREMLRWLTGLMTQSHSENEMSVENKRIPAGYTYLAQLVIHDSIQSLAPLPNPDDDKPWRLNNRISRLMLDTIYGGGPVANPSLYMIDGKPWDTRGMLRLGKILGKQGPKVGTVRDLHRSGCPYIDDQKGLGGASGNLAEFGSPDVLIADPRNDDNVVISQLTVLFHLLHNAILRKLEHDDDPKNIKRMRYRRFLKARRIVTLIYRNIVFNDLLPRLLHPTVYETYSRKESLCDFHDLGNDSRMPLEFSHGAARIGHAMVRGSYTLNDELEKQGIIPIVRRNSSNNPKNVPQTHDWLVDWSFLFELGKGRETFSRKIAPSIILEFLDSSHGLFPSARAPGMGDGLIFRDFVRGAENGLFSVSSLVSLLPEWVIDLSPLVDDGDISTATIKEWLVSRGADVSDRAEGEYVDVIAKDPPLLLFLLLEASKTDAPELGKAEDQQGGEHLGAIGSTLFAEFFFRERLRSIDTLEKDQALCVRAEELLGDSIPRTMPALIAWVAKEEGWSGPEFKFL